VRELSTARAAFGAMIASIADAADICVSSGAEDAAQTPGKRKSP
jgi:hypothetical protein